MISALALLLLAAPEARFEPVGTTFADDAACRTALTSLVKKASGKGYAVAKGPYVVARGDTRIHLIRAEAKAHAITEYRCVSGALSTRTWRHSMAKADEPFTIESVARNAEWLKKRPGEK